MSVASKMFARADYVCSRTGAVLAAGAAGGLAGQVVAAATGRTGAAAGVVGVFVGVALEEGARALLVEEGVYRQRRLDLLEEEEVAIRSRKYF